MRPDNVQPRADALDALWLEDWQRAQTLLLLAIVDQLVALAEYVTASDDDNPPRPGRAAT